MATDLISDKIIPWGDFEHELLANYLAHDLTPEYAMVVRCLKKMFEQYGGAFQITPAATGKLAHCKVYAPRIYEPYGVFSFSIDDVLNYREPELGYLDLWILGVSSHDGSVNRTVAQQRGFTFNIEVAKQFMDGVVSDWRVGLTGGTTTRKRMVNQDHIYEIIMEEYSKEFRFGS